MQTKIKNEFKAVDFMRSVRNELSELYHIDKERFHSELRKSMEDFLNNRKKQQSTSVSIDGRIEQTRF